MRLTTRFDGLKVILERIATEGVPQTRAGRGAAGCFGHRHRDYASTVSGRSHPMRGGSEAQPRSTGQGQGPCESRHGVVLQAIPGLAALGLCQIQNKDLEVWG